MSAKSPEKVKSSKTKKWAVDWWFGTVFLAFFPLIIAVVICLLRYGFVDINRIFGDGELILASFLVAVPTLIKCPTSSKGLHYLLLFSCFFLLVAYVSIKTNTNNIPMVVYITSAVCVAASVLISCYGETCVNKEDAR